MDELHKEMFLSSIERDMQKLLFEEGLFNLKVDIKETNDGDFEVSTSIYNPDFCSRIDGHYQYSGFSEKTIKKFVKEIIDMEKQAPCLSLSKEEYEDKFNIKIVM